MGHDQLSNHDMTITGEEHINSNGTNMVRLQRALCPNLYSAQRRRTHYWILHMYRWSYIKRSCAGKTQMKLQKFEQSIALWLQRSLYARVAIGTLETHEKREREKRERRETEEKRDRYTYISKFNFTSLDSCVRNNSFSYNYVK